MWHKIYVTWTLLAVIEWRILTISTLAKPLTKQRNIDRHKHRLAKVLQGTVCKYKIPHYNMERKVRHDNARNWEIRWLYILILIIRDSNDEQIQIILVDRQRCQESPVHEKIILHNNNNYLFCIHLVNFQLLTTSCWGRGLNTEAVNLLITVISGEKLWWCAIV